METVSGASELASRKTCTSGFRNPEAIECDTVGANVVGGSYLQIIKLACAPGTSNEHTHRAHMTKTLYLITGSLTSPNTSANRSSARPLLVVHSGNTTTGLSALLRMPSSVSASCVAADSATGSRPVAASMESSETRRKPTMGMRVEGARVDGEEMAAEPVPVRRPGVREMGEEVCVGAAGMSSVSQTGRTNIGLKLGGEE